MGSPREATTWILSLSLSLVSRASPTESLWPSVPLFLLLLLSLQLLSPSHSFPLSMIFSLYPSRPVPLYLGIPIALLPPATALPMAPLEKDGGKVTTKRERERERDAVQGKEIGNGSKTDEREGHVVYLPLSSLSLSSAFLLRRVLISSRNLHISRLFEANKAVFLKGDNAINYRFPVRGDGRISSLSSKNSHFLSLLP